MRISPVYNCNINKTAHTTSFKSSSRRVVEDGFDYSTSTAFFRNDIDWQHLIELFESKYKNTDKVNVIIHACSSGEEAYSVALRLRAVLGEKAEKYFPLIARDVDRINISMAKKGIFKVDKNELEALKYFSTNSRNDFVVFNNGDDNYLVAEKDGIAKQIKFFKSNILHDIEKIPRKNTILFCRNFWPYLKIGDKKQLVKQIAKKLDSSSLIVLGYFDTCYGVEKMFEQEGFRHTKDYCVMEKMPKFMVLLNKLMYKLKLK